MILIKCVLVEGKPFLFGTLCHHETLLRAWFVWNHPLFGSLTSLFSCVSMDISFLDVSFMDILQVMIYSFGIFSSLGISLSFGLGS